MKKMILIIPIIGMLFTGCFDKEKTQEKNLAESSEVIRPVLVVNPVKKQNISSRKFTAIARSHKQTKLSFKVKGNVQTFDLDIGDFVQKGEIIASLDSKPYKIQEQQSSFALIEATANLKNSKSSYDRVKKLYINQNASQSELDNAKALYNATKAKVANTKEQLSFAKLQLSYTILKAPKSGFVASIYVQKDENVNEGTPLVLLSDKDITDVSTQISENFINSIHKEDDVTLVFNAIKNEEFNAKVSEVAKITGENLKTFQVIVKLNKVDSRVKAGMASTIEFFSNSNKKGVLEVPSKCVLNDKNGYFVYVAIPLKDNLATIKRKNIKVGKLSSTGFEVYEGLSESDLVLKAGMSQVFEKLIVKLR